MKDLRTHLSSLKHAEVIEEVQTGDNIVMSCRLLMRYRCAVILLNARTMVVQVMTLIIEGESEHVKYVKGQLNLKAHGVDTIADMTDQLKEIEEKEEVDHIDWERVAQKVIGERSVKRKERCLNLTNRSRS